MEGAAVSFQQSIHRRLVQWICKGGLGQGPKKFTTTSKLSLLPLFWTDLAFLIVLAPSSRPCPNSLRPPPRALLLSLPTTLGEEFFAQREAPAETWWPELPAAGEGVRGTQRASEWCTINIHSI